jgi:hypothetical protein
MNPMGLYLILAPSRTVYFYLDTGNGKKRKGKTGTHKMNGEYETDGIIKSC